MDNYLKYVGNTRYKEGIKEGIREGIKDGIREGANRELLRIVKNLIKFGIPDNDIVKVSGISIERLNNIKKELQCSEDIKEDSLNLSYLNKGDYNEF